MPNEPIQTTLPDGVLWTCNKWKPEGSAEVEVYKDELLLIVREPGSEVTLHVSREDALRLAQVITERFGNAR